jgi:hypothetical protein
LVFSLFMPKRKEMAAKELAAEQTSWFLVYLCPDT